MKMFNIGSWEFAMLPRQLPFSYTDIHKNTFLSLNLSSYAGKVFTKSNDMLFGEGGVLQDNQPLIQIYPNISIRFVDT